MGEIVGTQEAFDLSGAVFNYVPFVLALALNGGPTEYAMTVNEDRSISVNWPLIEAYVAAFPVDRSAAKDMPADFTARCIAHALLALREGRVSALNPTN